MDNRLPCPPAAAGGPWTGRGCPPPALPPTLIKKPSNSPKTARNTLRRYQRADLRPLLDKRLFVLGVPARPSAPGAKPLAPAGGRAGGVISAPGGLDRVPRTKKLGLQRGLEIKEGTRLEAAPMLDHDFIAGEIAISPAMKSHPRFALHWWNFSSTHGILLSSWPRNETKRPTKRSGKSTSTPQN